MGKEKRYETTITRKLIDCCKTLSDGGVVYNSKLETRLSPNLTFIISFTSNNLLFDKAPEQQLSKRQIALNELLILFYISYI
jgi:hypothetical protein